VVLAAAVAAAALDGRLPVRESDALFTASLVGTLGVVVCGVLVHRPALRRFWYLVAAALGAWSSAGVVALVQLYVLGWSLPDDLVLALNVVGYLVLLAAAACLVLAGGGGRGGVLDAAVMAVVGGAAVWALVMYPTTVGAGDLLVAVSLVHLLSVAGTAGALLRAASDSPESRPVLLLLTVALACLGTGPVAYLLAVGPGLPEKHWSFALTHLACGAVGAAALHPSMPALGVARPAPEARVRDRHLVALGAALVCTPVVVGLGTHQGRGTDTVLLTVASVVSVPLVMVRIRGLVREREAAQAALADQAALQRERESSRRVVEERLRIAREVHDTVAHALVGITVRADGAAYGEDERNPMAAALADIRRTSSHALRDLRATLEQVREDDATQAGAGPGLEGLADLVEGVRSGGLDVDLRMPPGTPPVPAAVGRAAFRITQEALTNVLRHARATTARVEVAVTGGFCEVEVVDDGSTAAGGVATGARGHGLTGMAERAAALGGDLTAGPRPGGGWQVRARLPLSGACTTSRATRVGWGGVTPARPGGTA